MEMVATTGVGNSAWAAFEAPLSFEAHSSQLNSKLLQHLLQVWLEEKNQQKLNSSLLTMF